MGDVVVIVVGGRLMTLFIPLAVCKLTARKAQECRAGP